MEIGMPVTKPQSLEWIVSVIRERGKIKVAELAAVLGVSYHYFRYSIVKLLTAIYEDIILVRENGVDYLVYRGRVGVDEH
jgi:hypothetical protein